MKIFLAVLAITAGLIMMSAPALADAKPKGSPVTFGRQGEYRGYFAPGVGEGKVPGLVLIHEWWGLNDAVKAEAEQYAHTGYNVLAVDLFGKVAATPAEARAQVQGLNQEAATAHLLAAADYLRTLPTSNGRVGSLGWCFGGGQALTLAIHDPRLDAVVLYYGQPVTDPQRLAKIAAPLLGHFGEADASIPLERVTEFDRALAAAVVARVIYTYPGAGHAFANPTNTNAYHRDAAVKADQRTADFLRRYLR